MTISSPSFQDKNVLKEIIVVDDGSKPPLRKIMSEQLLTGGPGVPKMKIVRHEHTLGLISAKKSGQTQKTATHRYMECLPTWFYHKFKSNLGKYSSIWSIWGMGDCGCDNSVVCFVVILDLFWENYIRTKLAHGARITCACCSRQQISVIWMTRSRQDSSGMFWTSMVGWFIGL